MKKSVLSVLCILGASLGAQNLKVSPKAYHIPSTKHFNAVTFQVENSCYVRLQDFEKNTAVRFYSSVSGGKRIASKITNEFGNLATRFEDTNMPAFLLSKKQISEDSTQIFSLHFDEKEFIVKDLLFHQNASSIQLNFSSISSEKDFVTCKVHFVDALGNRNLLGSYDLSDDWANYALELPIEKQHQQIQMSIYTNKDLRYRTVLEDENQKKNFEIYPTLSTSSVHLDVYSTPKNTSYYITSIKGETVLKGSINNWYNTLDVSNLPNGNYIVSVDFNGVRSRGKKFIKL